MQDLLMNNRLVQSSRRHRLGSKLRIANVVAPVLLFATSANAQDAMLEASGGSAAKRTDTFHTTELQREIKNLGGQPCLPGHLLGTISSTVSCSDLSQNFVDSTQRYFVAESRTYGQNGEASTRALLHRSSKTNSEGETSNRFHVGSVVAYDSALGVVAKGPTPQFLLDMHTTPDRLKILAQGKEVSFLTDSANLGASLKGGDSRCTDWTETTQIPSGPLQTKQSQVQYPTQVLVTISMQRQTAGCKISWHVDDVNITTLGGLSRVNFGGAVITDFGFEVQYSEMKYSTNPEAQIKFGGKRAVLAIDHKEQTTNDHDIFAGPFWRHQTDQSDIEGYNNALIADLASVSASAIGNTIEASAVAFAEQKSNPAPLITIAVGAYLLDSLSTTFVNAAGAAVAVVGAAADNQSLVTTGNAMLGYDGVISTGLQATANYFAGQQAATAVGLGYDLVSLYTPAGLTRQINQQIVAAALANSLLRPGRSIGALADAAIDLAVQNQNLDVMLNITKFAADKTKDVYDWVSEYEASQVADIGNRPADVTGFVTNFSGIATDGEGVATFQGVRIGSLISGTYFGELEGAFSGSITRNGKVTGTYKEGNETGVFRGTATPNLDNAFGSSSCTSGCEEE